MRRAAAAGDGSIAPQAPAVAPAALSLLDASGEIRPLEDVESEIIRFAIAHYRGQMSEVARRLQIGRSTLYRKLDTLGLDRAETPRIGIERRGRRVTAGSKSTQKRVNVAASLLP